MTRRLTTTILVAGIAGLFACRAGDGFEEASASITAAELAEHVQDLAADSMEGRSPSSRGEERTVRYLQARFEALGLQPGNGDSWVQEVPLLSLTADPDMGAVVRGRGTSSGFRFGSDYVAVTERLEESVTLDGSPLVFAGYGIVAPEYGWDDYDGLDVTGRTVVVLINDPGYVTEDPDLFNGRAMTYYGRWTYKYEEAARQGAAGVLIVHRTGPAGYPWEVVEKGWSGPQFVLAERADQPLVGVEGWLSEETARAVFAQAGFDFDVRAAQAAAREFEPYELGLQFSLTVRNRIDRSTSRNVIARLRGTGRPDETIIYTAHWDHLGLDPEATGDGIYNGARDNATGTAGLLEMAEAFRTLDPAPVRSVVFLAVTAEEQGLLGSAYYAAHPVYPLDRTVAAINMDGLNIWGPTHDITVIGYGMSELDDVLQTAAETAGRVISADPEPEKGSYYRSDHFEFAKLGVPSFNVHPGIQSIEHGEEWGRERLDEYTTEDYHKPSDEWDPSWDLQGATADLRLLFAVGYSLATGDEWPAWREETQFKSARDSIMGFARAED